MKNLPIVYIASFLVGFGALQTQVRLNAKEIDKIRPQTTQVARIEERTEDIKEDFIDFRDEQRKMNEKTENKLDKILEAVMK